ncbi:MAG: flagellar export chaperone FliS [Candidatus Zixiibacteriota bacterium]|nr:MAG: flagellar export chaperone FliS [candidate division Zixibacteria bacterium]
MAKKELKTYRDVKIKNMSQKELIVFLYESALELIDQGKERIGAGDVPGTNEKLDRARNIFLHLLATLNLEEGGEFAKRLSALYSYFVEKITMANTCNKVKELDEIIPLVNEIKEAWEKMENNDPGKSSREIMNNPGSQLISMEV